MPKVRPFEVSIIDNNLLRAITKKGKAHLYEKYYYAMNGNNLIDGATDLVVTPAGTLEFLGQTMPALSLEQEGQIRQEAIALSKAKPFNYDKLQLLRKKLLDLYDDYLKNNHFYSKSKFTTWTSQQRAHTDEALKDWIFKFIDGNTQRHPERMIICNRVALDRAYGFSWPVEIHDFIFPAYLADLHHAYDYKIGYGSMRGLRRIWTDFVETLDRKLRSGTKMGSLPESEIRKNVEAVNKALSFDTKGDFLDVEAIHYLCVGRFHADEQLRKVVFATQDPVDKFLIRLGVFKSFYKLSFESVHKDGRPMNLAEGVAVVFDSEVKIEYIFDVASISPLLDHLGNVEISEWLREIKERSRIA